MSEYIYNIILEIDSVRDTDAINECSKETINKMNKCIELANKIAVEEVKRDNYWKEHKHEMATGGRKPDMSYSRMAEDSARNIAIYEAELSDAAGVIRRDPVFKEAADEQKLLAVKDKIDSCNSQINSKQSELEQISGQIIEAKDRLSEIPIHGSEGLAIKDSIAGLNRRAEKLNKEIKELKQQIPKHMPITALSSTHKSDSVESKKLTQHDPENPKPDEEASLSGPPSSKN